MRHRTSEILLMFVLVVLAGSIVSCNSMKLDPVQSFDAQKYLGKWYEIARFDFKYEKNLSRVTAEYSLIGNGKIKVLNTGYDFIKGEWKQTVGKAKFAGPLNEGALKVSFFGPFYSAYTVIALDEDYSYALVAGANRKLLWILSRTPTIPDEIRARYLEIAQKAGFDTSLLIWTEQDQY